MLINPIYMAGGSPAPSSGYVEDGLLVYYEGNAEKLSFNKTEKTVTESRFKYAPTINSTNGWTYEAYFEINGNESYEWQGIFGFAETGSSSDNHIDFYIGEISGSNYSINPYVKLGETIDDIINNGMTLDNKYTVSIVSVPNADGETANSVHFYVNGAEVGETHSQSRDVTMALVQIAIEDSSINPRPMNGKLYNGRFYTRALTAAELAANHTNDVTKYGGNG